MDEASGDGDVIRVSTADTETAAKAIEEGEATQVLRGDGDLVEEATEDGEVIQVSRGDGDVVEESVAQGEVSQVSRGEGDVMQVSGAGEDVMQVSRADRNVLEGAVEEVEVIQVSTVKREIVEEVTAVGGTAVIPRSAFKYRKVVTRSPIAKKVRFLEPDSPAQLPSGSSDLPADSQQQQSAATKADNSRSPLPVLLFRFEWEEVCKWVDPDNVGASSLPGPSYTGESEQVRQFDITIGFDGREAANRTAPPAHACNDRSEPEKRAGWVPVEERAPPAGAILLPRRRKPQGFRLCPWPGEGHVINEEMMSSFADAEKALKFLLPSLAKRGYPLRPYSERTVTWKIVRPATTDEDEVSNPAPPPFSPDAARSDDGGSGREGTGLASSSESVEATSAVPLSGAVETAYEDIPMEWCEEQEELSPAHRGAAAAALAPLQTRCPMEFPSPKGLCRKFPPCQEWKQTR